MFENFNTIDFIILGFLCLMNIACIVCIIFLVTKKNKNQTVLESPDEIKVTKITEEVNKPESVSALDEIIETMKKDMDSEEKDPVELFEQEQEEKAIISYQELVNTKKNKEEVNKAEPKEEERIISTPKLVTTEESKFTTTEFVSPVFGKLDKSNPASIEIKEENIDAHELEKTLNIEPLADEIKKNNEFLNALKEFRKNL